MKSLTMKSLLCGNQLVSKLPRDTEPTENLSSVNCGPRDVLEVVWVRIEAVSKLDTVRS
jgi:hypothetical protein